jgi:hypothetical protein
MTRCQAQTLKGEQCKKTAITGTHYCSVHSKQVPKSKIPSSLKKSSPSRKSPTKIYSPKALAIQKQNKGVKDEVVIGLQLIATKAYHDKEGYFSYGEPLPSRDKKKAAKIILETLFFVKNFVTKITFKFDKGNMNAIVVMKGSLNSILKTIQKYDNEVNTSQKLIDYFKDHYGDGAADTWMEGDIDLDSKSELFLDFYRMKIVAI